MYAVLGLLVVLGSAAAQSAYDDGQYHPELDGSPQGSGDVRYGTDDGSWKPNEDGSWMGRGDLKWPERRKREAGPNTLSQPADEPAAAEDAQLRQQSAEGARNIIGGEIPTDLAADTPEIAEGKQANAISQDNQKLATGNARFVAPAHGVARIATPVATPIARVATPIATPVARVNVARIATPVARVFTPRIATPLVRIASPVAHFATPVARVAHVATPVARVAHVATSLAHVAPPIVRTFSPYHYSPYYYSPVVRAFY